MTRSLDEIFDSVRQQVREYYAEWQSFHSEVGALLDGSTSDEQAALSQAETNLSRDIGVFEEELAHPRITLAATGTTSSGKSSLVNLLCGAQIMPAAVLEMSAGTVVIDHHPYQRRLYIPPIDGVSAELAGEWLDISDSEIKSKLTEVMNEYLQLRKLGKEPSAPRFELVYPTRIGLDASFSGLPRGFRLRILDLPGLKYIADKHNREVIRNEVRPALCLVTYGSEETDPFKQRELLREIVDQVRALGGSPARMLFLLNRIDVFRRHDDWQEQTAKHIADITASIRSEIATALKEHTAVAEQLLMHPLSTEPALYAYQALHRPIEESLTALRLARKTYRVLFDEEIEPPGKPASWSDHERAEVARQFWQASYGDQFDILLRNHITDHLPEILLPHLLTSLKDTASDGLRSADQIAYAYQNASEERYREQCARLAAIAGELKEVRDRSSEELFGILTLPSQSADAIGRLRTIAEDLEQTYGMPISTLVPLYDWFTKLGDAIEHFLTAVADAINDDTEPKDPLIESLAPIQRTALMEVLSALRSAGFKRYAGKSFKAESTEEQRQLAALNEAINKLGLVLADNLGSVLESTVDREIQRIIDALQELLVQYAEQLVENASAIAPDLYGLSIDPPSRIFEVRSNLILAFVLDGRFPISKHGEQVFMGNKRVRTGSERRFYTLWLWEHDVYENVPVYETRLWNEASIPSVTDLVDSFIDQAKRARPEREFVRWLHNQIEVFLKDLDKYQADLLAAYQRRLDETRNQAGTDHERSLAQWQGVGRKVAALREQLDQIRAS